MKKYSNVTFTIRSALFLGALTGFVFAGFEIGFLFLPDSIPIFSTWYLIRMSIVPLVVYAVVASIGTGLLSILASISLRLGGITPKKDTSIALFVGIGGCSIFYYIYLLTNNLQTIAKVGLLLSIGIGGIAFIAFYLLAKAATQKFGNSKTLRVMFVGSIVFVVFWYALVWQFRHIRLHNHPFPISQTTQTTNTLPNIILIVLDTLRADHLSSYGYTRNTTPEIDAFAKNNAVYTNAYATAPWTLPSHASILTGLYPSQHGADGSWNRLSFHFETLPEILQKNGYVTAAISNNLHFSPKTNLQQGFDHFIYLHTDHQSKKQLVLAGIIETIFQRFPVPQKGFDLLEQLLTIQPLGIDVGANATNALAQSFIQKATQAQRPFFLMTNYMEVHDPYGVTPDAYTFLDEINVSEKEANREATDIQNSIVEYLMGVKQLSEKQKQIITALYDGDIVYLDRQIGKLLDFITQEGLLDNTLIVITSDHGENLGDHELLLHVFDIRKPLTHVPLIIHYPQNVIPAQKENQLVQLVDIAPTILDITNSTPTDSNLTGISLLDPVVRSSTLSEGNFKDAFGMAHFLDNFPDSDQRLFGGVFKSINTLEYDYTTHVLGNHLYNKQTDPSELSDIVTTQQQTAKQLHIQLEETLKQIGNYWSPL